MQEREYIPVGVRCCATVPRFWANNSLTAAVPVRRPEDLFPAIVAGVPRTEASMYDNGKLGTGRRAYSCAYTRQGDAPA